MTFKDFVDFVESELGEDINEDIDYIDFCGITPQVGIGDGGIVIT